MVTLRSAGGIPRSQESAHHTRVGVKSESETMEEDRLRTRLAFHAGLDRSATLEQLAARFAEKLHNGPLAWWGASAAMHYPARERLPHITQPVLVLRPHDDLWDVTPRARELLPEAKWVDLPEQGFGLFEVAPELVAGHVRAFLDD